MHHLLDSPWCCVAIVVGLWIVCLGIRAYCTGKDARSAGVIYRDDPPLRCDDCGKRLELDNDTVYLTKTGDEITRVVCVVCRHKRKDAER